jgi:UDP-N-acetylmuramoyl-L-alanyl-D-glutamate--2,6-diaminopimelate ligase
MQIKDLIHGEICGDCVLVHGDAGTDVLGVTADSRKVEPGMIFAALSGLSTDGSRFIADAVTKGAVALLIDANNVDPSNRPAGFQGAVLAAVEPRRVLAQIAAQLYAGQPKYVVAITGTNGKTSVADFTRQVFVSLGRQAASLGTIGIVKPSGAVYGSLTTPDPVTLHQTLASLAAEGVTHLAMEASSHGLDQFRLDGVKLAAGAFLNLGRDHLDYHPDIEHYLNAKLGLFERLLAPGQPAIVNADAPFAAEAIAAGTACKLNVLTVGANGKFLRLIEVQRDGFGQRLTIEHAGKKHQVHLNLIGDYQAANALAAAAFAIALGENPAATLATLQGLQGVSGRLEVVGERNGGLAVVDYAHKPEALAAALAALRPFVSGKLICVMGCGGNRDAGKRPIMGRIAAEHADLVIVTDDNPRKEVPADIRKAVLAGIPAELAAKVRDIGDRGEAIAMAVSAMQPGDVVLIAGKGHETGQIVGDTILPFSDQAAVRAALVSS